MPESYLIFDSHYSHSSLETERSLQFTAVWRAYKPRLWWHCMSPSRSFDWHISTPSGSTKPGNIDMKHYIFLPKSLKTVARAAGICVCIIFGWISVSHLAINSKEVLVVGSPTLIESRTSTMRWVSPLAASKNPVYGWTVMRIFATLLATLSLQLLLLVSWLVLMDGMLSDASFSVVGWNPPIHQTSIVSITVPSIETQRAVWKSNVPFAGQCCERLFNSPVEVLGTRRVLVYGFVGVWKKSLFSRRRGGNHPYLGSNGSNTANCLTILGVHANPKSWSVWVGNLWSMFTSLQRTQQTLSGSKEPPKKSLDLSVRYCLRDIESLFRFCRGLLVASAIQDRPKGVKTAETPRQSK